MNMFRRMFLWLSLACIAVTNPDIASAACNSQLPRESPNANYVVNTGGDTVTDANTGLTWRRCQLGMEWVGGTCSGIAQGLTWRNALLAVQSINDGAGLAGKHDWRLPDLTELMTLVDHACFNPAINTTMFPNTAFPSETIAFYWSSTPDGVEGSAWVVNFQYGMILSYGMANHSLMVRPVRGTPGGGQVPPSVPSSFVENFDSIDEINAHGWLVGNMSNPVGTDTWVYGDDSTFQAQSGASTSFVSVNYNSTGDNGTISNWLLTPLLDFRAGSMVSFWTRTVTDAPFADRLQVRVCRGEPCDMVGPGALGTDGFETLLLDINPSLQSGPDASGIDGYPDRWTRFTLNGSDGVPGSGHGRIAFRYFVEDGGLNGAHSVYIGLDSVRIEASLVE